eukprot:scpid106413/ scgid22964/ 
MDGIYAERDERIEHLLSLDMRVKTVSAKFNTATSVQHTVSTNAKNMDDEVTVGARKESGDIPTFTPFYKLTDCVNVVFINAEISRVVCSLKSNPLLLLNPLLLSHSLLLDKLT